MRIKSVLPFATEFPVKRFSNKAAFPSEVFAWLRGMKDSEVLSAGSEREFDGENVYLVAGSGEELRLRELQGESDWIAVGFQHDVPDDQGRTWRTEAVLRRGENVADYDILRLRTQCLAKISGAVLDSPKKPYIVKALLNGGWGALDGILNVCDQPLWLDDDQKSVEIARQINDGVASVFLPIVYVSAGTENRWPLTKKQLQKLAYDLGGIAHVIVEPSRGFSTATGETGEKENIQEAELRVVVPHGGIIRRFLLGRQFSETVDLINGVRTAVIQLRGSMPSVGWDWTELQEYALRKQRASLRESLSKDDANQLFDDFTRQVNDLQEENHRLKEQLNTRLVGQIKEEGGESTGEFLRKVGREIYPGEIIDRIRFAAHIGLSVAESNGIDLRTIAVWRSILDKVPRSSALGDLRASLDRATKDPRRLADEIQNLLQRHGYRNKSDNKHVRLEPEVGYDGLQSVTVSKTPSEQRGLKNQRTQIERTLGLSKLP